MKRVLLFITIVAPIVALLAFGLTRNPRDLPSTMVGKRAPDFLVETLDGKKVSFSSFVGKPIVLNFWATWCGPCFYEHAALREARKLYEKSGVQFLGIVYQDQKDSVAAFIKEEGEPFKVLFDPQSQGAIAYGVGGVPETFFIDAKGIIRNKFDGVLTSEYLQMQIENLQQK